MVNQQVDLEDAVLVSSRNEADAYETYRQSRIRAFAWLAVIALAASAYGWPGLWWTSMPEPIFAVLVLVRWMQWADAKVEHAKRDRAFKAFRQRQRNEAMDRTLRSFTRSGAYASPKDAA